VIRLLPCTGVFALFLPAASCPLPAFMALPSLAYFLSVLIYLPAAGFDGTAFVGVLPVCAAVAGAAVAAAAIGAGVAGAKTARVDDLRAESCALSALTSVVCV